MGGVHAGKSRIHKAHKVGAHLMLGFFMNKHTRFTRALYYTTMNGRCSMPIIQ